MYGPWLLVQRRRLAKTLEVGAGCRRLATGGCEGRGTFLSRNPEALLAERREGLSCEVNKGGRPRFYEHVRHVGWMG